MQEWIDSSVKFLVGLSASLGCVLAWAGISGLFALISIPSALYIECGCSLLALIITQSLALNAGVANSDAVILNFTSAPVLSFLLTGKALLSFIAHVVFFRSCWMIFDRYLPPFHKHYARELLSLLCGAVILLGLRMLPAALPG